MKTLLILIGMILLGIAFTLQMAINEQNITIICLWLYVVIRNVQEFVE
jgi:hypothetical protein